MDFIPLSASPLSGSQILERKVEARGNLRPVLAFVKKVRGVAVDAERKKNWDRFKRHCGASKRT
jgi:hypothetical protein